MAKYVLVSLASGKEYPTDSEVTRVRLMASNYRLKEQEPASPAKPERMKARQAPAAMGSPLIPESKPSA